ncbi:pre-mRNA-splicing factor cwc22 [Chytridiales sp. JEL 0842]|nr:pre-mRNA-splicing factor cwc22 [Chytridiales sp. JEL 0842]
MVERKDQDAEIEAGPTMPPPSKINTASSQQQQQDESRKRRAPPSPDGNNDEDRPRKEAKQETTKPAGTAPKSFADRMGGAYIPPAKLRAMQAAITDKSSVDYQRMTWEALKKSLNGLINKVNAANIKMIVPEIFSENLVRGRGLLCRSLMKAQAASLTFTPVFAALVAVINSKFPQIGELLLVRLISQYRRAYRRNDKGVCLAVTKFIAHLVNQKVAHEILALQILTLLLERPTDDSVEVAVGFMRDVGAYLADISSRANNAIYERFRSILHEGSIDKRTQYMVEVLFQVRRDKYKDNPPIPPELELVDDEDQITHHKSLDDDDLDTEDILNVFKEDPNFVENEEKYNVIKREILGDESDEEDGTDGDDEDEEEDDSDEEANVVRQAQKQIEIQDATNTNLINLRRGIYLTIMSSATFEECAHKLMKISLQEGQEIEMCNMIIECCSQERTYRTFFGLLGERFCRINPIWANAYAKSFEDVYKTVHRYETNRLRNIAKFFAHLMASDALTWNVFALVSLTEQDTTSASRIFVKILFEELNGSLGLKTLKQRLSDKNMMIEVETPQGYVTRGAFDGLFPRDNPRNTRFAINYFTSIGLGGLTTELREHLKNAPKLIMAQQQDVDSSDSDSSSSSDSDSDSSSSSSGSSSSSSSSGSESDSSSSSSSSSGSSRSRSKSRSKKR